MSPAVSVSAPVCPKIPLNPAGAPVLVVPWGTLLFQNPFPQLLSLSMSTTYPLDGSYSLPLPTTPASQEIFTFDASSPLQAFETVGASTVMSALTFTVTLSEARPLEPSQFIVYVFAAERLSVEIPSFDVPVQPVGETAQNETFSDVQLMVAAVLLGIVIGPSDIGPSGPFALISTDGTSASVTVMFDTHIAGSHVCPYFCIWKLNDCIPFVAAEVAFTVKSRTAPGAIEETGIMVTCPPGFHLPSQSLPVDPAKK